MPILELEAKTSFTSFSVHGMDIHDAPGHHGVTRLILPENTLVLNSQPVLAHIRWEGRDIGAREWGAGLTAFLPADSELITRVDESYRGTLVCLKPDIVQMVSVECDVHMSAMDFGAISTPHMSKLTMALVELANVGALNTHPMVSESLATALVVETIKGLSPRAEKALAALKGALSLERKRRVIEYVDANLHKPITLAEMAGVANLSLYHFGRSFKQAAGMSPAAYLLRRRIARAKHLLRGMAPIAQVAFECGFSSQSHLGTAFKALTGVTPKQFRNRMSVTLATLDLYRLPDIFGTAVALAA